MVQLGIKRTKTETAELNPDLFNELIQGEESIISIKEPNTGKNIVSRVTKKDDIGEGKIGLNLEQIRSLGIDENFPVEVSPFQGDIKYVNEVKLGISPSSEDKAKVEDRVLSLKKNEQKLLKFLQDKIFTVNTIFEWDEYDVAISIEETNPVLGSEDVGKLGEDIDFSYKWTGGEIKSFNGVLFLDISMSMEEEDMNCEGVEWAIERMSQEFDDPTASNFFDKIRGRNRISRLEGSLLAAMKYLVEKIGRGVGEKTAVILYTTEAHVVQFDEGVPYYDSSQPPDDVANRLLKKANETFHGKTNLLNGLKKAKEITKDFPINKMKMFVILTDGKVDDEKECYDFFRKHIYPRGDIVINTLGLGDSIHEEFLEDIAQKSGGQYHHVDDLKDLVEKYSEYAMNLEVRGAKDTIDVMKESKNYGRKKWKNSSSVKVPRCPQCESGLSYYQESWFCHSCEQYVDIKSSKKFPICGKCGYPLSFFEEYEAWYCYNCEKYSEIDDQ